MRIKIVSLIVTLLLCVGFVGCDRKLENVPAVTFDGGDTSEESTREATTSPKCDECQYLSEVEVRAKTFSDGLLRYTCKVCKDSYTESIPATKSIKILAVGNSFSNNAVEYLYSVCKSGGVEEIVLGNLYIGACTLQKHLDNINGDNASYDYYLNTEGKWNKFSATKLSTALKQTDWDVITVQQNSLQSGMVSTFGPLEDIVKYLKRECTNSDVQIYWHMTWAYQSDFTEAHFSNYNWDQKTMYDSITSAVKNDIANRSYIDGVIPVGTAVQNLRTSYFGDTLTRDGYHLNYGEGYYVASLTWFAYITGGDISEVGWMPSAYANFSDHLEAIREAVKNAVDKPYEITDSSFKEAPKIIVDWTKPSVPDLDYVEYDTDADRFSKLGLDISDYELLDWGAELYSFYGSTGGTTRHNSTNSSIAKYYVSSKRLYKTDLPIGSIIIVDTGFQYRPEGWESESYKSTNETRESNVFASVVTVDESWWKNYEFRGFNLSVRGTRVREVNESDIAHLRIYVPKQ